MTSEVGLKIRLAKPFYNEEIKEAVIYALENERYVLGESVYKFEEELAKYFGVKYAVTTSSGTTALHLSLLALGLGSGGKVITTPYSFVATSNSVIHAGGVPVFVDIKWDTMNIDPEAVKKRVREVRGVKGIIPVHLYGHPADMDEIMEIAEEKDLFVLEDACQAHGAIYKGRKAGSIGNAAALSFYPSKNITVLGDGGAVLTNDDEVAITVSKLRDCGRRAKYVHDVVGYTARLNTINAAIGRVQLKYLDKWIERRRQVARLYRKLLSDVEEVILPPEEADSVKPAFHLYVIRTRKRDELKKWLESNRIECGIHYPLPIHLQPVYRELFGYVEGSYPISERASRMCLSIPMHPFLKDDDVKFVSERIREFFGR